MVATLARRLCSASDYAQVRAVGWLAAALSFCAWASLDARPLARRSGAHWARAALALATHALAAGAPLAHIAGCRRYSSYRVMQPFEGGFKHVVLQALGWTLYAASLTASLVLLRNTPAALSTPLKGVFGCIGAAGLAAHGLVDASVALYEYEASRGAREKDEGSGLCLLSRSLWFARTHWGRLGVALQAFSAFLLVGARGAARARVPDEFVRSVAIVGGAGTTLAACIAHGVLGRAQQGAQGYRLWAPFEGGEAFVCLQALGWLLLATYLNALICVLPLEGLGEDGKGGVLLAAAVIGTVAVLLIMASVGNFDGAAIAPSASAAELAHHQGEALSKTPPRTAAAAPPEGARLWCGESAVASCLLVVGSVMASLLCRQHEVEDTVHAAAHGVGARASLRLMPLAPLPVSYEWALRIACAGIHLAGPIAHFGGTRLYPPGVYRCVSCTCLFCR